MTNKSLKTKKLFLNASLTCYIFTKYIFQTVTYKEKPKFTISFKMVRDRYGRELWCCDTSCSVHRILSCVACLRCTTREVMRGKFSHVSCWEKSRAWARGNNSAVSEPPNKSGAPGNSSLQQILSSFSRKVYSLGLELIGAYLFNRNKPLNRIWACCILHTSSAS